MSNQPFSFPPPPPPPPKRTTENSYEQNNGFSSGRGSFRGGGGFGRGAGRGGRGSQRGSHHVPYMGHNNYANRPHGDSWNRNNGFNPPQKRDHTSAFNNTQPARPRPTAAPAVPSFNASIEHLLPRKPAPQPAVQHVDKPKKQNLLGLTPTNADPDSELEDDEGEETRLATQAKSAPHGLEIEYRGQVSTLQTAAEIAAWIAERKARYPTAVKVEAAKKEAAEKKRKWEEEKAARFEANRQARIKRDEERKQQQIERAQREAEARKVERLAKNKDAELDSATMAEMKAEKLRKKALKAEQRLVKAEEALRIAQEKRDALAASQTKDQSLKAAAPDDGQPSQLEQVDNLSDPDTIDADATSSSGTSTTDAGSDSSEADSDSDSAPEVISTKQTALVHDLTGQHPKVARVDPPRLCNTFAKTGRCKFGSRCRYTHDTSRGKKTSTKPPLSSQPTNTGRKGLWEVMVEKEQEEERKRLLEAIITLGERGILDDPGPT
ncbi:hypothetical protein EDD36DRAFT_4005 [Exophiala viscosa]|uniref:C3H1-type domain-containing protein n=1 Tax=Exophiala viscosa TaxID=2486360 RepID=A0AAN6E3N3_9EURO|nr:hypothetical protein EDD36DRAFT_4005 [Exophiala viscosa]